MRKLASHKPEPSTKQFYLLLASKALFHKQTVGLAGRREPGPVGPGETGKNFSPWWNEKPPTTESHETISIYSLLQALLIVTDSWRGSASCL